MTLLQVVEVLSGEEAREALRHEEVQGVVCAMLRESEGFRAALGRYRVPRQTAIGPLRYTPRQPDVLGSVFLDHLEQLEVSADCPELRHLVVEEILATLRFFSDILGGAHPLECKIRFQRPESLASRPHYDPSALTLLRTFLGPGTWLLPKGIEKIQTRALQMSIHKGTGYPGAGRSARMLHDYPSPDDPAIGDQGRIVLIASSRHGV